MAKNIFKQLLRELFDFKTKRTKIEKEKPEAETAVASPKAEAETATNAETLPEKDAIGKAEIVPELEVEKAVPTQEISSDPPPNPYGSMGDGYCIGYEQTPNGYGYYRDANIVLYRNGKLVRRITDRRGYFLDFPGVEHGPWERDLTFPFVPRVDFTVSISNFKSDGLANFRWTVQPDGRYWEDEDGFGTEKDVEIELDAKFNKEGVFVTPFRKVK